MAKMIEENSTVYVVDDDPSVRKALERLLRSVGYRVVSCAAAQEFLDCAVFSEPCCLVLDIQMSGLDGLELQGILLSKDISLQIVFITGHGTVPTSVKALKAGAVDFLEKPFQGVDLLDAVARGLKTSRGLHRKHTEMNVLQKRFSTLTPREKTVFTLVAAGNLNKQIASELGIVEKTIKVHRAHVMEKMGATSVADLVRFAEKLRDRVPHPS